MTSSNTEVLHPSVSNSGAAIGFLAVSCGSFISGVFAWTLSLFSKLDLSPYLQLREMYALNLKCNICDTEEYAEAIQLLRYLFIPSTSTLYISSAVNFTACLVFPFLCIHTPEKNFLIRNEISH